MFSKDVALHEGERNRVVNKSNRIKMVIQLNILKVTLFLQYTVPVFLLHSPTGSREATLLAAIPPVRSTVPGVLVLSKCLKKAQHVFHVC